MSLAPPVTAARILARQELASALDRVQAAQPVRRSGRVQQVIGLTVAANGPTASIGELCHLVPEAGRPPVPAEVVGFRDRLVLLMPLGPLDGVGPGCEVRAAGTPHTVCVGDALFGRVLNGLGEPMDGGPPVHGERRATRAMPPHPLGRPPVDEALPVGVRALDGLLTCGKGQRMGIFSGSGVGKSTLLGMIARYTAADVTVIALVGERGREVREFLTRDLGPEGLARSIVVVATSDQPALVRAQAAYVATTIAEHFRDRGRDVMLLMDSMTRFAMALREVGLSVGEPPATRGYTPSVFAALPKLLERAGRTERGSITGFYTVLVEGDDLSEPVTDAMRGLLDGHVALSRELAGRGQYPAIDLLNSISRIMPQIASAEQLRAATRVRALVSAHRAAEDLINIGAYAPGSNPEIDAARAMLPAINSYLQQAVEEPSELGAAVAGLIGLAGDSLRAAGRAG
jgi:flagellum-specific ATP synthase